MRNQSAGDIVQLASEQDATSLLGQNIRGVKTGSAILKSDEISFNPIIESIMTDFNVSS